MAHEEEAEAWRAVAARLLMRRGNGSDFLADTVWHEWAASRTISARTRDLMLNRLRWWEADALHWDPSQRESLALAALWLAIDAEEQTLSEALSRGMEAYAAVMTEDVEAHNALMRDVFLTSAILGPVQTIVTLTGAR